MRPSLASVLAVVALAASLAAAIVAGVGALDPGVVADNPGGIVRWVDPGGPAWVNGIRPGQTVESVAAADDPAGWSIETFDGTEHRRFALVAAEASLRATLPLAVAAMLCAGAAVATSRTRRRRSELLAVTAICLASMPYLVADPGPAGIATVFAATLLPPIWFARRSATSSATGGLVVAIACGSALAWLAFELDASPLGAQAGNVHLALLAAGASVIVMASGATPRRIVAVLGATRTLDVLVVAVAFGLALTLAIVGAPAPVVLGAVLVPLGGYARARNAIGRLADRLIVAEFREREALRATEEERARISREIHDEPLQTLAGVIAQLEDPGSDRAAARQSLRAVAQQLRDMATELHPPVIDDLGLAPAIEFAARGAMVPVEVEIENHAGYGRTERPPVEVELAVYRIAAEAIMNASRHAQADRVSVAGSVTCHAIEITVADDGCGIPPARIEEAQREGHLGLTSMRRRALAIDGELAIASRSGGGTEVTVRWTA